MSEGFRAIVETYPSREHAEALAERLKGQRLRVEVIPGRQRSWDVVVPVVQYSEAKRFFRGLPDS